MNFRDFFVNDIVRKNRISQNVGGDLLYHAMATQFKDRFWQHRGQEDTLYTDQPRQALKQYSELVLIPGAVLFTFRISMTVVDALG